MEKNLDEWFENFNLEEAVKKLEKTKAKVVNADDDNRKMVEESEIKVELEEEEKRGVVDEKEEENIVAVNEVQAEGEVLVDDSYINIVEELIDEVRDPYVLEIEVKDHNIGMVNEVTGEIELKEEYHEAEIVEEKGIELYGIEFENSKVGRVVDVAKRAVELLESNDHQWIFKDVIDRIHDEWYERVRRFTIVNMSYDGRHVIDLGVNAEKL